ncbi:uncharacterized protein ACLA_018790 [Aspergillus clavatus NRRL 1]|uniref:Uncharacterized protein n=1 Tax=Aspergillus clavatus (strain ATCC 1007 / CBS 513.65 / DSM 816 / NCTC 3887 / NRRL 1 / QM 1276 / 107) TaxID=344612 RepID=A1CNF4_ASPCL|nr:uncharacterized protein ACLA_018790 [Aspergillus clavatus NRRL 1]EAW07175.1 hypothetical protein ACLA_018790 [Aspergillus clavatus NRRL 1]
MPAQNHPRGHEEQPPAKETVRSLEQAISGEMTTFPAPLSFTSEATDGSGTNVVHILPTILDTTTATATSEPAFTTASPVSNTYSGPTTIASISPGPSASSSTTSAVATTSALTITMSAAVSSQTEISQPDNSNNSNNNNNNTARTIAIAVPVSVVGAALLFGALFFFLRRRRRRTRPEISSSSHIDVSQSTRANLLSLNGSSWGVGQTRSPTPFEVPLPSATASTDRFSTIQPYPHHAPASPTPRSLTFPLPASPATQAEQPGQHQTPPSAAEVSPASEHRPGSPFDHPMDDAMSEVSRLSDRRESVHDRDLDDDVSSVSSISDDELDANRSRTRFNG